MSGDPPARMRRLALAPLRLATECIGQAPSGAKLRSNACPAQRLSLRQRRPYARCTVHVRRLLACAYSRAMVAARYAPTGPRAPGRGAADAARNSRGAIRMSTNKALSDFAAALVSGSVKVVDLTAPLGPDTPVLYLPPEIGRNTPAVKVHEISHYDRNGPFWAWNWLELGEHTGTHFDAPVHWITGRDHKDASTDQIPVRNFVAPVCVIDRSKEAAKNPDYLLTPDSVKEWEREHGGIEAGNWVLLRTDWYKRNGRTETFL